MKRYLVFAIFLFPSLIVKSSIAQVQYDEVCIGDGLLSYDQFAGIFGQVTPATGIMSFPSKITGAAFLSYRHYFSKKVALGGSLGIDNQSGNLSYGKDGIYGSGTDAASGHYKREVYTGTAELIYTYGSGYKLKTYGYVGAGYTSNRVTFHFFDNIQDQNRFYGTPGSLFLNKNTTVDFSHFNFQVTPIGFRVGNALAAFIEFGFGYKGIINAGMCYTIGKKYYTLDEVNERALNGLVLIPPDFPVDSTIKKTGDIRSGSHGRKGDRHFSKCLAHFSAIAKEANGNAFSIKQIIPADGPKPYNFKGVAYHSDSVEALKAAIVAKTKRAFPCDSCAYVVIYRNDFYENNFSVRLKINDTNKIFLDGSTACITKVKGEKMMKIRLKSKTIEINTSVGAWYYINVANRISPRLESVDAIQGTIESSVVDKTIFYDIENGQDTK